MAIKVVIPAPLQRFSDGNEELVCDAKDFNELMDVINLKYPALKEKLCSESGQVKKYFNIYVDGEDIRFLEDIKTDLTGKNEVIIVAAVAGGFSLSTNLNIEKPSPLD